MKTKTAQKNIPDGWKQVILEEVTTKISDGLHTTPKYVESSDYYFINGNNLVNDRILISGNTKAVAESEYNKHKKDIGNSTILLSINGTIGSVARYEGEKVVLGKSAAYINCSKLVLVEYVYAFLKNSKIKSYFLTEVTGSTIKNLSLKSIKNTPLLLAPLLEQNRIVKVLGTWDKAIEVLVKKIECKREIKKGLMQNLLTGKIRLPGFSDKWENKTLSEIFTLKKGSELSKEKLNNLGKFECILYGELYTTYDEVIYRIKSKTNTNEGTPSVSGDILIPASTTTGAIDLAVAASINKDNVLLGGDINILRSKVEIDSRFFAYYLTHVKKHNLARLAQGVTIVHLYSSDFKNIKIEVPDTKEQIAIANVITVAEKEIVEMKIKLCLLKDQKKYLLNNLITGIIRTPENI